MTLTPFNFINIDLFRTLGIGFVIDNGWLVLDILFVEIKIFFDLGKENNNVSISKH